MLRLLISILSILAAQALDFQNILKASRWTLKAAHHGISKHVDVSWEDLKQIQDRYKAHRPMQIRNTDKQWSVDHAFKFLLKHGQRFEGASIKAQSKGFDFEGTLHGTQYNLQCAHRCRVHRLGDYRDNSLAYDTHEDDMTHDEWLLHRESDKKLNLLAGESINPSADSTLNCLRVIATQDCEAHGFAIAQQATLRGSHERRGTGSPTRRYQHSRYFNGLHYGRRHFARLFDQRPCYYLQRARGECLRRSRRNCANRHGDTDKL